VPQFIEKTNKLKTIESIQARSTILTLSNQQIQNKFGKTITTTLDKASLLEQLNHNSNLLEVKKLKITLVQIFLI
jgi:hypothetical protein